MIKNYYKILEVSRYASDEVIKASYRAMAKKFHPDRYYGDKTYAQRKMETKPTRCLATPKSARNITSSTENISAIHHRVRVHLPR